MPEATLTEKWEREFLQEKATIQNNASLKQHEKDTQIALRQQHLYDSVQRLKTKFETILTDDKNKLATFKQANNAQVTRKYVATADDQLCRIGDLLERFLLEQKIMAFSEKEFLKAYEYYWNCGNRLAVELFNQSALKLTVKGRMLFSELKSKLEAEGFTDEEKIAIQNVQHFERELVAINQLLKQ
jgi:hypothetical protein